MTRDEVEAMVSMEPTSGCWLWLGNLNDKGYGRLYDRGRRRNTTAHRTSWSAFHGAIPDGLCVLHRCDSPPCVNPGHLFLGTIADNNADKAAKGRVFTGERPRGEMHRNAKLTVAAVVEIRRRCALGESQTSIAAQFGVTQTLVSQVNRRLVWAHIAGVTS